MKDREIKNIFFDGPVVSNECLYVKSKPQNYV